MSRVCHAYVALEWKGEEEQWRCDAADADFIGGIAVGVAVSAMWFSRKRRPGTTKQRPRNVGRSVERLQINSIVDAAAVDVFRLKRSGRQRSSDETIRRWVNVAGRVVARLWSSNNFS